MRRSKVQSGKAGDRFELLAAKLFQSQGFLVRRSLPLRLTPQLDATDVDVFGTKFVFPFQRVRLICDCKDRIRSHAIERMFWAKGLASCINANEVYIFVRTARLEVVQYGNKHGVRVLTDDALMEFYSSGAFNPDLAYSYADEVAMTALGRHLAIGVKKDRSAKDAVDGAILMFYGTDPYEDFNVCIDRIDACSEALHSIGEVDVDIKTCFAFALSNYIVALSIQLLTIASDTLTLTRQARRAYILQRLTYGSMSQEQAHAVTDAAVTFVLRSIPPDPDQGAQAPLLQGGRLFQPPNYAEDVVGLVERALANPKMYHSLPSALDFTLFDGGLHKGRFESRVFDEVFSVDLAPGLVKATKNVFALLRQHTSFLPAMVAPPTEHASATTARAVPSDMAPATESAVLQPSLEEAPPSHEP